MLSSLLTARFSARVLVMTAALVASAGARAGETEPSFAVVDLHTDVPWQVADRNRSPKLTEGQARIDALRAGGYGALVLPIYISDKIKGGPKIADAERIYEAAASVVAASSAFLPLRSRFADQDKITTFLAIEGAGAFAEDITAIDRFIERGVRLISLAHARNNKLASAATDKKADYGITDLGKQLVRRIYDQGALIDVSHLSDAGFADLVPIAAEYGAPIVATHSNARALCNVPRNLTDDELRMIGKTGGVAGLNYHAPFVASREHKATLDDLVAQAEHMIQIAGIDHVALGSDFDGDIDPVEGMEDASKLPVLAKELRRRGHTNDELMKVFSQNALRVLSWRAKAKETDGKSPSKP